MTNYAEVNARALLVSLHVAVWGAQRFDRAVSDAVTDGKHADRSSGRFNKHLFGTTRAGRGHAPEFFAVIDAADRLRNLHDRETLPWSKRAGERLLPVTNYFDYMAKVRAAGGEFELAVEALIAAYPRLQEAARTRLAGLYRAEDFVARADLRWRFHYEVEVTPVPGGGDVRLDLPQDQIRQIEAALTERMERTTREAMRDAWARLHEAVTRIARASGEGGIVRESLLENARMVCDVLQRLNVAQDADLEQMRRRVEAELTVLSLEDLRTNDRLRTDTESRAQAILAQMAQFYAPVKADAIHA